MHAIRSLKRCYRQLLGWLGQSAQHPVSQPVAPHPIQSRGDVSMPQVVMEWNNVLLETYRKVGGAPSPLARAGAMMHVAMYDAINVLNTGTPRYKSYLADIPDFAPASAEVAAVYAAYGVLSNIYPNLCPIYDQALQTSLDQITGSVPQLEIDNGRALGEAIANLMIDRRTDDGSANNQPYKAGTQPGDWRPTGSGEAVTPNWLEVAPFVMAAGNQFRPPLPGGYQTMPELLRSSEYTAQFEEVKRLGEANSAARTAEQTEIAFFWANDLDGTYKPPGHLYRCTQIVAEQRNLSLLECARLFALVGLALADAGIVAWDSKYGTNIDLWRPEAAIKEADTDSNLLTKADPNWEPLSVNPLTGVRFSPPFPAYVSGHATFGAAHAGIMRRFFGTDNVTFQLDTDDPSVEGITRTFNSFSAAALENGRSRVYLGVHFQWDADEGYVAGTNLANFVFDNALSEL